MRGFVEVRDYDWCNVHVKEMTLDVWCKNSVTATTTMVGSIRVYTRAQAKGDMFQ
jgi:hypothetical protein